MTVQRPAHVGSIVIYWDPKKGQHLAHVLEVQMESRLKLRVHRTATPDYDVKDVPYSEEPKKGHWSRR